MYILHLALKSADKEVVGNRFRPRCATADEYLPVFIAEQNLVELSDVMLLLFYRPNT